MIDDIAIDYWFSENFASIENIKRKCNPIVDLSKFTFNKNILSEMVVLIYNQVLAKFYLKIMYNI